MATSNSGAKTAANAVSWNRKIVIVPNRKTKFWLPMPTNAPVCAASSAPSGSAANADELAQKKISKIQNLKRHFFQHNLRIFSKSTKCGLLCWNNGRNAGSGQRCAVAHAKSSPMPSVIAAKRLVSFSGSGSLPVMKVVKVSVICGMLINSSCRPIHTRASAKVKGKPITWNAGITA